MKSQETLRIEERINKFVAGLRKEGEDRTINDYITFELVEASHEEGSITLLFPIDPWMKNIRGVLHGGILCSLFDTACGITSIAMCGDRYTPTANLDVNFLRSLNIGEHALIKTKVTHLGRLLVNVTAEASCKETGRLCGTASATFCRIGNS